MVPTEGRAGQGMVKSQAKVRAQQTAAVPARKLIIKPLKSKPKLPDGFEAETWAKLQDAVHAVHAKRPVSCSLEELYRAVEDMCLHRMADRLYGSLQRECDAHIGRQLADLAAAQTADPTIFLQQVQACWADHCQQMLTLRSIFLYLDRTHAITTAGVRSLFEMGLQLFRTHLAAHPEVEQRVVDGLLGLIAAERGGETVDRGLLSNLLRCFTSLGMYATAFQEPFLRATVVHYAAEGQRHMAAADVAEYLVHCERRLAEEYERCQHYLDPATRKPLIAAVEAQLLERHIGAILEKGFNELMTLRRLTDLARLYSLATRIHALDPLKAAFRAYIKSTGLALILDEEKDKEMVPALLDMKAGLDAVLNQAFQGAEPFAHALKDAFEHFINQRANRPAELVAKFIDAELRSGGKGGKSDDELEATLDKALMLFRYIQGKDVFEAFYKKDLAKRLLLQRSVSNDAEKAMITKLKAECGSQFTNKLEGMFNDMELSHDIVSAFQRSATARARIPPGFDMNVSILTSGYWPTYPILDAVLPEELSSSQAVFKDFYLSKHSGRRLVWHNSLGTCMLRAQFPKGLKELSVSLFQATVLMLFNDVDTLALEDIAAATRIEDRELRRTLQSLACGKVRVMHKEPKGREVEDGDVFRYNADFTAALFRVKINAIQLKDTVEENKKTNDQVLQDRQYQIDAAIVRVMKTRKTLSHKLLVAELLQQLKFPIKQSDLKKRIESLIDREYLERDEANANVYIYLA